MLSMQERKIYVVSYEVKPLPESKDLAAWYGAAVNVWVEASSKEKAIALATQGVQDAGWSIKALESAFPVTRDSYSEDSTGLGYFEQALIDGVVLVFHTWRDAALH